jgi:hypothetical protein
MVTESIVVLLQYNGLLFRGSNVYNTFLGVELHIGERLVDGALWQLVGLFGRVEQGEC